jgi:ketosteroid isomerase-like protein
MKKNLLLLIIAIGMLTACKQEIQPVDTEKDIAHLEQLLENYCKYAEAGDLENFISCFDENAIRSEPGMPAFIGKEKIKERFKTLFSIADNKLTVIAEPILEICGDVAYSYTEITLTSTPVDGSPVVQTDMKVLTILKRQEDDSWKIYIDNFNYSPTWTQDTIPEALIEEGNPYY